MRELIDKTKECLKSNITRIILIMVFLFGGQTFPSGRLVQIEIS